MKIYTKTGDKGETSLIYGERVAKDDARVEAYGTCDEANSLIGLALVDVPRDERWDDFLETLRRVQTTLFHVGSELATPSGKKAPRSLAEEDVLFLENKIDQWNASLPPLFRFVLPGGGKVGATLHVARTVVRRAERKAISIGRKEPIHPLVIQYLNRLSDLLYVAARYANVQMGQAEQELQEERKGE